MSARHVVEQRRRHQRAIGLAAAHQRRALGECVVDQRIAALRPCSCRPPSRAPPARCADRPAAGRPPWRRAWRRRRRRSSVDDDALGATCRSGPSWRRRRRRRRPPPRRGRRRRARRAGALPPSSSTTGLRYLAQVCAISLPTRVEPVKLTRRTAGCAIIASTTSAASSGALVTKLTTPGGKPGVVQRIDRSARAWPGTARSPSAPRCCRRRAAWRRRARRG